jgi:photosystem II stability/assembly factor-like uncharacterized protein
VIARRVAIAVGFGLLIAGAIVGKVADRGTSGGTAGRTIRLVAPNGVRFVNSAVGWVTDDHGQRLLMTSDGGGSWVNISPPILGRPRDPPQLVLAGALFESRSSFWVAVFRYRGGLAPVESLHTTDDGRTWTDARSFARNDGYWRTVPLTPGGKTLYGGNTLSPRYFNAQDGVFTADLGSRTGGRSAIYTTTTAGVRWTAHAVPGGSPVGAVSIASPTSWVAAAARTLYMTNSAGRSWRARKLAIGSVWGLSDTFDFLTPTDGWAITDSGPNSRIWHTTTSGRHWTKIQ